MTTKSKEKSRGLEEITAGGGAATGGVPVVPRMPPRTIVLGPGAGQCLSAKSRVVRPLTAEAPMTGAGRASTTGGAPMMDGVATDEIGDDERPRPSTRPTTAVKLLATIPLEETELAEAHPTRTPRLPDPDGQPGSMPSP